MIFEKLRKSLGFILILFIVVSLVSSLSIPPSKVRRLHTQTPDNNLDTKISNSSESRLFADLFSSMMSGMMNTGWGNLLTNKNVQLKFVPLGSILFPSNPTERPLR